MSQRETAVLSHIGTEHIFPRTTSSPRIERIGRGDENASSAGRLPPFHDCRPSTMGIHGNLPGVLLPRRSRTNVESARVRDGGIPWHPVASRGIDAPSFIGYSRST